MAAGAVFVGVLGAASSALAAPAGDELSASEPASIEVAADERAVTDPSVPSEAEPAVDPASVPIPWRVWPLFDPFVSRRETVLAFGLDQLRDVDSRDARDAWTVGIAQGITTTRPFVWVNLERRLTFRSARRSTYMLDISQYQYTAGVRLFGLELGAGVGLSPLVIDVAKGDWSVSGISPSAVTRAGFKVGVVRVSVDAFSQYLWRWYGGPDARIQGFSIQLALEQPRTLQRKRHPLILTY